MKNNILKEFDFTKTLKTDPENTFFNIQSIFHLTSKQITKFLYYTNVTPHQIILISLILGIMSSFLIVQESYMVIIFGAVLLFYKNVLDKVDGSLARAKNMDTRRGRFYDSYSDFIVNLFIFTTMGISLFYKYDNALVFCIIYLAMIVSMLQCSYFIYYQVSFIKLSGKNTINRINERITSDDLINEDKITLFLQKYFRFIYGWQDTLIAKLDLFLLNNFKKNSSDPDIDKYWYLNKRFLTISSSLSIGTHLVLIAVFSIFKTIEFYLFVNLILMNLLLIFSIFYHYKSIKNKIKNH